MRRRKMLTLIAGSMGLVAGCPSQSDAGAESMSTPTPTGTQTLPPTQTETPRENSDTILVAPNGSPTNPGTRDQPLSSTQEALRRAQPGQTVHVRPGTYNEYVEPPHGGKPGAPITITGPPDAVLKPNSQNYYMLRIRQSHIHLTGLTIDGLKDPENPEQKASYDQTSPIVTRPHPDTDEYLQDLVIAPHAVGNSQKALVAVDRTQHSTIGPFKVSGLAGAKYFLTDTPGHNGEIVYLGTSPSNLGTDWHPWTEYDRTKDIRVHHIDNSAGHPHSELVNTKLGTSDIRIEYCTDGGESRNTEDSPAASVRLQSFDATVRWCDLRNGAGHGIEIGSYKARDARETKDNPSEIEQRGGSDHAIYGNRISGFDDKAVAFPVVRGQDDQRVVCRNTIDRPTDGTPDQACSADLPQSDEIGHTGGDSPWA